MKPGDKVIICGNINKTREEYGEKRYAYLDEYIGKIGTILSLSCVNDYGENCWYLDIPLLDHHTFTKDKWLSVCERNLEEIHP
jgi:hypothetical protein